MLTEHGARHLGGPHAAYDLPTEEYVDLIAHLLTRDAPDGWQNTLAPVSAPDHVYMSNVRSAPAPALPPRDPALAAFHDWAAR